MLAGELGDPVAKLVLMKARDGGLHVASRVADRAQNFTTTDGAERCAGP